MSLTQEMIDIDSPDGTFQAYLSRPEGNEPRAALIVIQEIFGVNEHIRSVCDRYAEAGYACIAPELFWRVEPGFSLGYEPEDIARGREVMARVPVDSAVDDVFWTQRALEERFALGAGRTGVVGYCWGGLVAYLCAARLSPTCVSAYYGGGIANYLDEVEDIDCPIMFHFGSEDAAISADQVARIREAIQGRPAEVFSYDGAGHGFNCEQRASHHPDAARIARERTLRLLEDQLG